MTPGRTLAGRVPKGDVRRQGDGSYTVDTRGRGQFSMRPDGSVRTFRAGDRREAQFRPDGSVRTVRSRDTVVYRDPLGVRRVHHERPDRTIIVSEGHGFGYIDRPFRHHDHDFVARAFYGEHGYYTRFYSPYRYHGLALHAFIPHRYFAPMFYGWAYAGWASPIYYRWGWLGDPWYGYYGPYYSPFGYYPSAWLWLSDYLISNALQQDYNNRVAAAADESIGFVPPCYEGQVPLTDNVKQAIAQEVRYQLSMMNAESQTVARNGVPDPLATGLPRVLSDATPHTFVVSNPMDVAAANDECILTPGDVVQLSGPTPSSAPAAYARVLASKGAGCPAGSVVAIPFADLQEMLNNTRATLDQGLGELQAKQGQGGLPAVPAVARTSVQVPFAAAAPPPDPNGAEMLSQVEMEGNAAEQGVLGEAIGEPEPAGPPPTIRLGQSMDEVVGMLGSPVQVVDLGAKQIYVYKTMKITFLNGRVSDVQ